MKFSFLFLSILLLAGQALAAETSRERIRFDGDWKFHQGSLKGSEVDNGEIIPSWRWKSAGTSQPSDESPAAVNVETKNSDWKDAANGQDVFNRQAGFAWYRAPLPNIPGPSRVLHFAAVDDSATVWVNGQKMLSHDGWNDPFDVPLDSVWKEGGPNVVAVLVHNTYSGGYIKEADLLTIGRQEKVPPVALDTFDDKDWRKVHLPHDFVVEGTFNKDADGSHGFLPKDMGWYRKTFMIPADDKGKSLWIDFDGVYRDSRVWLNGKLLGRHASGYTSFRYDITSAANYGGKNILTVNVDARVGEGWWYEGGGIYRHVWLNKSAPLHIAPDGVYVVSTPKGSKANLEVETTLVNDGTTEESCLVVSEILDAQGESIVSLSTQQKIPPAGKIVLLQKGFLLNPILWDLSNPYLYRLVTRLERSEQILDQTETSFGIRSVRFDKDKGFFLNDKPVKLKGTCNHQDFAGVGTAMADRIFNYRVAKLKEMGSNAYRCSHNPPATELLDECDRQGMLVLDENRRLGDSEEILAQVKDMLLRDRNHPSIIAWSLCNEESLQDKAEGAKRGSTMKAVVQKYDKTRLVTAAMNYGWGGEGLSNVLEVQGFNYNITVYDSYRASHLTVPLYGSETASTVSSRGIYANDKVKGYVSAYDVNHPDWAETAEKAWKPIAERDWMAGAFVWTGFDYRGEPTPYYWPCVNSHFGILDMCGFPKDNFYYYKAWWGEQPVLHLLPHWNWAKDQQVAVWAQSNADQVELFLNGKSLEKKAMPKNGHLEWQVKYEPGTLSAKGYDVKGNMVSEDKVETTGKPASIKLEPYQDSMIADGEDAMPVKVSILDEKGRVVPLADNEVTFKVEGAGFVAGVANGDPSSHEPDKGTKRHAFNGLCMVVVGAGDTAGEIKLTAEAGGLKSSAITLKSTAP